MGQVASNARLIEETLAGNRQAFGQLVERYLPSVHAVALAQVRNPVDAQDVSQDAFLKAFDQLPKLREPDRFEGWVTTIARNTGRNLNRAKRRERGADDPTLLDAAQPPTDFQRQELHRILLEEIDELKPDAREVLLLFYFAGKSTREIASLTNISASAVKKRLERARNALSDKLLAKLGEDNARERLQTTSAKIQRSLAGATPWWHSSIGTKTSTVAGNAVLGNYIAIAAAVVVAASAVFFVAGDMKFLSANQPNGDDAAPAATNQQSNVSAPPQIEAIEQGGPNTGRGSEQPSATQEELDPAAHLIDFYALEDAAIASAATLEDAMSKPVSITFADEHIENIIDFLSEYLEVNFVLDYRVVPPPALPDQKQQRLTVTTDGSVLRPEDFEGFYVTNGIVPYLSLTDVTGLELLRAVVRPLDLDFVIRPGFVWISTTDRIRREVDAEDEERFEPYLTEENLTHTVSITSERGHIEAILEFIKETLRINTVVDYRVVQASSSPDIESLKGSPNVYELDTRHGFLLLDYIFEYGEEPAIAIWFGTGYHVLGSGEKFTRYEVLEIDIGRELAYFRSTESDEHFVLTPMKGKWRELQEEEDQEIPPVKRGVIPTITLREVNLQDALVLPQLEMERSMYRLILTDRRQEDETDTQEVYG